MANGKLTFEEFERRVGAAPPLELGWRYWNWLLPDTAPLYFWWFVLWPVISKKDDDAG